jgi:succinylglutamic semialdehyde dehydrogenase
MDRPTPALDRPGDYVDGRFEHPAQPDGELVIHCPGELARHVSTHPHALAQLDAAVDAARRAQPLWDALGEASRRELLERYQARLRAHREEIALTLALEVGKPLWEARTEVDAMIGKVDLALGEGARFTHDERIDGVGEIRHRPLGVLAVIGPFNFPGHLPNGQLVPALLLGNTVVHKPSEQTPSAATWMARCFDEAGAPPGVFNVVQGGPAAGSKLTQHADVDGVLFTGSARVGQAIVRDNAHRPHCLIALELGGKNATLALDDCDLELTARALAFSAFATAGQRCSCSSRLYVTRGVAGALVARIAEIARGLRIGHPLGDDVFMGPVISSAARQRVLDATAAARAGGYEAVLTAGAIEVPGHAGHYLAPSIHRASGALRSVVTGYTDDELFGPDLAVYEVDDLEAGIAAVNESRFGLVAAVFTSSATAFEHAALRLRVGVLAWNRPTAGASSRLPFGGIKHSGNHRPAGILAGTSCSYPQGVMLGPTAAGPLPSWPGSGL